MMYEPELVNVRGNWICGCPYCGKWFDEAMDSDCPHDERPDYHPERR